MRLRLSVPAHDLESTVVKAIIHWLGMYRGYLPTYGSASDRQAVLDSATSLAKTIREAEPKSLRGILMPIIERVTVGAKQC
jgi:hypothetical protein